MQITRRGADYRTPFQTMAIDFCESLNLLSFKFVIINVNNEISVSYDIILEVSISQLQSFVKYTSCSKAVSK